MQEFKEGHPLRERPEENSRARLKEAARIILEDIPDNPDDFTWAADILGELPNPDLEIIAMIRYEAELHDTTRDATYEDIVLPIGMRVDIFDPQAKWEWKRNKSGHLVTLAGVGQEEVTGLRMPIIKGQAIMRDANGIDTFIPVGVTANGTVFKISQKVEEE